MTFLVRQAMAKMFKSTPDDLDMHIVYDVSHNIAKVRRAATPLSCPAAVLGKCLSFQSTNRQADLHCRASPQCCRGLQAAWGNHPIARPHCVYACGLSIGDGLARCGTPVSSTCASPLCR